MNNGEILTESHFAPWFVGKPNGERRENCVQVDGTRHSWNDVICHRPYCGFCQLEHAPEVQIRGLCEDSIFDNRYSWIRPFNGERHAFRGFLHSLLYWNLTLEKWYLTSYKESLIIAELDEFEYPFGTYEWTFFNEPCYGKYQNETKALLNINTCNEDEFNCHNGYCVSMSQRCDRILDCPTSFYRHALSHFHTRLFKLHGKHIEHLGESCSMCNGYFSRPTAYFWHIHEKHDAGYEVMNNEELIKMLQIIEKHEMKINNTGFECATCGSKVPKLLEHIKKEHFLKDTGQKCTQETLSLTNNSENQNIEDEIVPLPDSDIELETEVNEQSDLEHQQRSQEESGPVTLKEKIKATPSIDDEDIICVEECNDNFKDKNDITVEAVGKKLTVTNAGEEPPKDEKPDLDDIHVEDDIDMQDNLEENKENLDLLGHQHTLDYLTSISDKTGSNYDEIKTEPQLSDEDEEMISLNDSDNYDSDFTV